jgi:lipoprotein signal peptidase
VAALILLDQGTKAVALALVPPIDEIMYKFEEGSILAMGLIMHMPDPDSMMHGLYALAIIILAWTSKIPTAILCLWTACAISNHVESLVRPGVVDWIALPAEYGALIFNLADAYVIMGIAMLAASMIIGETRIGHFVFFSRFYDPFDEARRQE